MKLWKNYLNIMEIRPTKFQVSRLIIHEDTDELLL
jgi:hypothetical protein